VSLDVEVIGEPEAELVAQIGEGQFSEVKAIGITPSRLTKTLSAFANSDGGDLYIGVDEIQLGGGVKRREWAGFPDVEAANGFLQSFERLFPLGTDFQYDFFRCEQRRGLVLRVQVRRTQAIMRADDGLPYVRRGASSQPVNTAETLRRLEYAKGIVSFESEVVNTSKETVTESPIIRDFLRHVVPSAEPEAWLKKQKLINDGRPTVSGLLLFAEEPQAALPKRCGVKVYRYKTKEAEGFRDVLAFDPKTVEGCLYDQIKQAVAMTVEIAGNIPRMGEEGLEKIRYPHETLHEIITNAVIHRDYSIADDVHIRIFDNRIEVQSPGRLPAHVTVKSILQERFARNGTIVRLLNKFPDPPNKDVGEGLNTAFAKMNELGLKEPQIEERDNDVLVVIRHELLASPEETIMKFLETHETIKNKEARGITGVRMDYQMKSIFAKMERAGLIEQVPDTRTYNTAYRRKLKA
jgi:ATP-dependent DNA helicase RecG